MTNTRKIKFRGWSKKHNKLGNVEQINFKNKTLLFDFEFYKHIIADNYYFGFEEVELMQYTGLKDTKDVEIYEGDIVEYSDELYEIKWMFSGFYLHDPKGGFIELAECDECCEVVGNIYENPELLEVKDEIKKEWEKLGYKWKEEGREITLEHKERSREIYIDKIDKAYYSGYFLIFQELNLLTKTFKALNWSD